MFEKIANQTSPIQVYKWKQLDDNSVILDFDRLNEGYLEVIPANKVEECAKLNEWLTKYDSEGEDYEITFEGFMSKNCNGHSEFELKHAIELAKFYLKEIKK